MINCSASCFYVCESSCIRLAISRFRIYGRFSMFLTSYITLAISQFRICGRFSLLPFCIIEVTTFETPKPSFTRIVGWRDYVHHKLLEVIDMIQQQLSSTENRKLMLPANALCSVLISTH